MLVTRILILFSFFLLHSLVKAETEHNGDSHTITILIPLSKGWDGETPGDRNYNFIKYLSQNISNLSVSIKKVPPARAIKSFQKMKYGCFLGGNPDFLNRYVDHKLEFYQTGSVGLFTFVLSSSHIHSLDSSMRLGVLRGTDLRGYEHIFPSTDYKALEKFNNLEQAVKLLQHDRIDAILTSDVMPIETASKLRKLSETPWKVEDYGLNCISEPLGKALLKEVEKTYLPQRFN